MDQQKLVRDMEERARLSGVSMNKVCIRAGVHPTTFSRWKKTEKNREPGLANTGTIDKLNAALDFFEAKARAARSKFEQKAVSA